MACVEREIADHDPACAAAGGGDGMPRIVRLSQVAEVRAGLNMRNIAVSAPYMHDGRFASLAEVVDHYDHGVQDSPNLAQQLRNPDGTVRRLNLSPAQKAALIAFLGTLTDNALLTDPKFSDPFPP